MAHPERHNDKIRPVSQEGRQEPRRLVCPSMGCRAEAWQIEPDQSSHSSWYITAEVGGTTWHIAADKPICPYCAAALGDQHEPALDAGPFSHFVRSLAA
jgi:hypothetical protein